MIGWLFSLLGSAVGWLFSLLGSILGWLFTPVPLACITITFGLLYYYLTRNYDFWDSRNVPGPRPKFPWGTEFGPPFIASIYDMEQWLYYKKGGKKFCGYFEVARPVLYVGDPDLIRAITIKDFEHFTNRRDLVLSEEFKSMLSVVNGKVWKDTRAVMSPTFSSSKLRAMHQLCLDNASNLCKYVGEEMQKSGQINLKDSFGRFTMDNIASCAFGVNCNSFVDPNTEFASNAGEIFKPPGLYGMIRLVIMVALPQKIGFALPDPAAHVNKFFSDVVKRTVEHREKNGSSRRDFLQLLLESRNKENNERILSLESIVAQSVLFFIAGYDTTATLMTFAGYALATNPDCQRKAQQEIDEVLEKHADVMSYDAVSELNYLDRVLSEALRLYPPAIRLERECSKDYTLPGTDIHIPAGTLVAMPVVAMHRDPEYYPDPLKFDPDRFLPEEKEKRHPCTYIPFGSGPRNCIAMRFALFEAKVAMAAVLREYNLEPGPNTPPPPMPIEKRTFLMTPAEGMAFIRAVPRGKQ